MKNEIQFDMKAAIQGGCSKLWDLFLEAANSTSKCDTSPTQPEPILERRPQAA